MPDLTDTAVPRETTVVDIAEKFTRFAAHWSPKIIAETNGWEIKLVKAHGECAWHHHEVDEVFVVFAGELTIQLRGGSEVILRPGQLYVVPRGVEHRPHAPAECQLILVEPPGVINTGQAGGELTALDTWI
jgi:mannose-6-phosphate isomerase-like protein (cupin superfamily)